MTIREIANENLYTAKAAIEALKREGYYVASTEELPKPLIGVVPSLDETLTVSEEILVRGVLQEDYIPLDSAILSGGTKSDWLKCGWKRLFGWLTGKSTALTPWKRMNPLRD